MEVLPGERARPREERRQSKERALMELDNCVREDKARPTVAGLPMRWMSSAYAITDPFSPTSLASEHGRGCNPKQRVAEIPTM